MNVSIESQKRVQKYMSQSVRLRTAAIEELRDGRWGKVEELLWGCLMAAVKAVAFSRGTELPAEEDVRSYAAALAAESGNRKIEDAFKELAGFSIIISRIQDTRLSRDRLYRPVEHVNSAVQSLWEMVPYDEPVT